MCQIKLCLISRATKLAVKCLITSGFVYALVLGNGGYNVTVEMSNSKL